MSDRSDHTVDPADEGRHAPGPEPLWQESYYLDFVNDDGRLAGYTRLGVYPQLGESWWTTSIVGADRSLVSSNDQRLAMPVGERPDKPGMSVADERLSVEYTATEPLRTMTVRGRAEALVLDAPEDVYSGRGGRPTELEVDLTWTTDGTPYDYVVTTRYEIPCRVTGHVVVGDERLGVEGPGQRDHSWAERDWWALGWCWAAARLDDGMRVHWADIRVPDFRIGLGYVQPAGEVQPIESLEVDEVLGPAGMPTGATARVEPGGLRLEIEPLWYAPVLFTSRDGRLSRFPRAAARFRSGDGRAGTGWIEWNQPQTGSGTG